MTETQLNAVLSSDEVVFYGTTSVYGPHMMREKGIGFWFSYSQFEVTNTREFFDRIRLAGFDGVVGFENCREESVSSVMNRDQIKVVCCCDVDAGLICSHSLMGENWNGCSSLETLKWVA